MLEKKLGVWGRAVEALLLIEGMSELLFTFEAPSCGVQLYF